MDRDIRYVKGGEIRLHDSSKPSTKILLEHA